MAPRDLSTSSSAGSVCFVGGSVFNRHANSTGGSELQVLNLAERLAADHGWRVRFVARRGTDAGLTLADLPGPVTTFPGGPRFKWYAWIVGLTATLLGVDCDVYYQRGANALTVGTALAARLTGRPFVWAVASDRDCDPDAWMRGGGAQAGAARPGWGRLLRARALGWSIRRASLVLCQTEPQMDACVAGWGVSADKVHLVRNGHAISPAPQAGERDCVSWIGSLKPVKRPELYVEIAGRLAPDGVECVMVGQPFGEPWASWVAREGFRADGVQYRGAASHDEVLELLARSVALVCTSRVEGFPNTFIEAWMCKTPVVSIGIDPDGTLSREGLGVLVDDVDGAVEALRALLGDPGRVAELGERCRAYVESHHDIVAVASALDALLRGLGR